MKHIVSFFGATDDLMKELNGRAAEYAGQRGFTYEWLPQDPYDVGAVVAALRGADAGIIDVEPYGEAVFSQLGERTKLLVRFGVGYDKVDLAAASRRGLAVARTTGANTLGVAEMAMTLLLCAARLVKRNQSSVERGEWEKSVAHETVRHATIGIVGFGAIGRTLAELVRGFGCRVIAYDPEPDQARMAALGVEPVALDELFATADAISLHVPYGEGTHHLVDDARLARMKPTAVLVNTSRGHVVDEAALARALREGRIAGAGLDVFGNEPLEADSPLRGLDNIVLTPHVSSITVESMWNTYRMAIDIAADFFAGQECPHILNPEYARRGA